MIARLFVQMHVSDRFVNTKVQLGLIKPDISRLDGFLKLLLFGKLVCMFVCVCVCVPAPELLKTVHVK